LSKAGLKILHIDENEYYGADEASLTIQELVEYCDRSNGTWIQEGTAPSGSRQFSLSLKPSILPATGDLIIALIESGVSRYTSFKLLDNTAMWASGASDGSISSGFKTVPTSKASIFSSSMPLPQKRKVMRLIQMLMACSSAEDLAERPEISGKEHMGIIQYLTLSTTEGGAFGLTNEIAEGVAFALGFCESAEGIDGFTPL
jgi:Rab proteins geranylgeranyltransferase component A